MKARLPQGYGKQNVNQLMQQAQKLQEDMKAKQEEMEAASHTVTVGGGMVEITMTGAHEVTALKLKPEIVDPEDIEMLEDLLAAAVNEAVRVVDEATQQGMASVTGALAGLNLPGGLGL